MLGLGILFALLVGGYLAGRSPWGSRHAEKVSGFLNRWVIQVALPALVLHKIHALPSFSLRDPSIYLPATQPWIQFLLALMLLTPIARILGWKRPVWGALVMTVGLGNTSFVGLPLLRVILGPESLATGILHGPARKLSRSFCGGRSLRTDDLAHSESRGESRSGLTSPEAPAISCLSCTPCSADAFKIRVSVGHGEGSGFFRGIALACGTVISGAQAQVFGLKA